MKKIHFIVLLCLTMIMSATESLDFDKILPGRIDDWKKADSHSIYVPNNLYEYINGGAELYISFGFNDVKAFRYFKKDNPQEEITVDIFDMGRSANAYGVFSLGCEECDTSLGDGSQYSAGSLVFWKERYYISILSFPENPEKKSVIMALGRLLAQAIPGKGQVSPLVEELPGDNLVPGTVRYFRHHIWLNSLFFIANENILDIGPQTEAAMAKYKSGDSFYYILLIDYPGVSEAQKARAGFLAHYLSGASSDIMKLEDRRWTGCRRFAQKLALVFNAPHEALVMETFDSINPNKKNQGGNR